MASTTTVDTSVAVSNDDLTAKAVHKRYEGLVTVRTKAIKGKGAWYWAHLEPILVHNSDTGLAKAVKLRCSLCDAVFSASNPSRTASEHLKRGTCLKGLWWPLRIDLQKSREMEGEKDGGSRGGGGWSGSRGGKDVEDNNPNVVDVYNQSSSCGEVESPPPSPTGGGGASERARCLQLLYLFPRNYEFHKDEVIQLWIAQELVDTENSADSYFKAFEEVGAIQLSTLDYSAGQQRYKLSDSSAHLLVQNRSHEFFRVDDVNLEMSENTKHASFRDDDSISFADLYKAGRLTTLMILHMDGGPHLYQIPRDLFLNLPLLRVLDFSHTSLTDLPSSIGILKDLRYLNLSCTPITALPKSLCSLHHMRTLKLKGCTKLVGLPKGMKNLINLRHLEVDLDCLAVSMPPGLGDLIQLQTLPAFVVGEENGCHITELRNLVNLSGTLNILGLENVSSSEEAKICALDNKKYLQNVVLYWTDCVDGFQVLENLQPHTQIEELQIVGYGGAEFPNWIGDCIFSRLATITLVDCKNCDLLPTLGQLPSLQCLSISDMHTVKNINSIFCGRNMAVSFPGFNPITNSVPYNMFSAFPSLEKLTLNGMPMLETWSGIEEGQFPNLQKLCISHCPKLTSLPELSLLVSLQQLEISLCPLLEALPHKGLPTALRCLVIIDSPPLEVLLRKGERQYWGKIARIANIWINYEQLNQKMNSRGDWNCRSCQHLNSSRRDSCQRCSDPKSGGGDWYCSAGNCGAHNFASRSSCLKCGAFKDESAGGFDGDMPRSRATFPGGRSGWKAAFPGGRGRSSFEFSGSDVRPGDWYCSSGNCGAHNFASRSSCFKCGAFKDESAGGFDGDMPRSRAAFPGGRSGWKSGGWICARSGCNERNFASWMECFRCNAPRDSRSKSPYAT